MLIFIKTKSSNNKTFVTYFSHDIYKIVDGKKNKICNINVMFPWCNCKLKKKQKIFCVPIMQFMSTFLLFEYFSIDFCFFRYLYGISPRQDIIIQIMVDKAVIHHNYFHIVINNKSEWCFFSVWENISGQIQQFIKFCIQNARVCIYLPRQKS